MGGRYSWDLTRLCLPTDGSKLGTLRLRPRRLDQGTVPGAPHTAKTASQSMDKVGVGKRGLRRARHGTLSWLRQHLQPNRHQEDGGNCAFFLIENGGSGLKWCVVRYTTVKARTIECRASWSLCPNWLCCRISSCLFNCTGEESHVEATACRGYVRSYMRCVQLLMVAKEAEWRVEST